LTGFSHSRDLVLRQAQDEVEFWRGVPFGILILSLSKDEDFAELTA
jgi:hypothetical protein